MRRPAGIAGAAIGLFRFRELASEPIELAEEIEGGSDCRLSSRVRRRSHARIASSIAPGQTP